MTQPSDRSTELEADHSREAIRARLEAAPSHGDLRDFIFGAIDGTVTTFAVVSGVSGAGLAAGVLIILGVANLVADGFSMGISNFLGTRAEKQQRARTLQDEKNQIRIFPEGEREEIRQIFAVKGFSGADLERVVEVITSDDERWASVMMREEHGYPAAEASPWRAGLVTYSGFMIARLLPILPFIYQAIVPGELSHAFFWSMGLPG